MIIKFVSIFLQEVEEKEIWVPIEVPRLVYELIIDLVPPEIQQVLITGFPAIEKEFGSCIQLGPRIIARLFNEVIQEAKSGKTSDKWYKSTFDTVEDSMNHHLKKHGKGRTIEEYTKDAMNFYNENRDLGVDVTLRYGTRGIKIQTGTGKNKVGGYWTPDGRVVTFWD